MMMCGNSVNIELVRVGGLIPFNIVYIFLTHLGNELRHEIDDIRIIAELPNKHDDLFHLNFALIVFSKDIVHQPFHR